MCVQQGRLDIQPADEKHVSPTRPSGTYAFLGGIGSRYVLVARMRRVRDRAGPRGPLATSSLLRAVRGWAGGGRGSAGSGDGGIIAESSMR